MECPRCFFVDADTVDDSRCAVCGRSYRPSVNVYLGLVALVYLVLLRYLNFILTGASFLDVQVRPNPPWAIFNWAYQPVDILYCPPWLFVLGLMMALVVLPPVVMSVLYGKRGGFLLAAIAALLGPSWLLGAVLFLSIALAGGWRTRMSNKAASAILACLAPWAFLLILSRPTIDVPLRAAYFAPAVVAVVISLVLILALFALLKACRWNARIAGVVLCVLCVLPIAAYKLAVGEDELRFELLSRSIGPESALFADIPASEVEKTTDAGVRQLEAERDREAARKKKADALMRQRMPDAPPVPGEDENPQFRQKAERARVKMKWEFDLRSKLETTKAGVPLRCREFLDAYPDSRHRPEVLYTMAQAADMEVDTTALRDPNGASAPIHFDAGRIAGQESRDWCEQLLTWFPANACAAVAMVKRADLDARQGHLDEALRRYQQVLDAYGKEVDAPLPDLRNLSVFTDLFKVGDLLRAQTRAKIIEEQFALAKRGQAFLVENRDCPRCHNAVLVAYLSLPRFEDDETRRHALNDLLARCPQCKLADNIACDLALREASVAKRLDALAKVAARYPGTDGAALALYSLADIKTKLESNPFQNMKDAIGLYHDFLQQYPKSYLAPSVEQRMQALENRLVQAMGATKEKP